MNRFKEFLWNRSNAEFITAWALISMMMIGFALICRGCNAT